MSIWLSIAAGVAPGDRRARISASARVMLPLSNVSNRSARSPKSGSNTGTWTSRRPGRISAPSSFSKWFVAPTRRMGFPAWRTRSICKSTCVITGVHHCVSRAVSAARSGRPSNSSRKPMIGPSVAFKASKKCDAALTTPPRWPSLVANHPATESVWKRQPADRARAAAIVVFPVPGGP